MKVTLNKKQLTYISERIKKKGVTYRDVNIEMTDHIASKIEEEMEQTKLQFPEALKKVFSKYDRFHFMKIEEEKVKKVQKQSWKSFLRGFVSFFTFPKILFTLCLFFAVKQLESVGLIGYTAYVYLVLVVLLAICIFYLKFKILGEDAYLQLVKFHWIFVNLLNIAIQLMSRIDSINKYFNSLITSVFVVVMYLFVFIAAELYYNEFKNLNRQYSLI